MTGNVVSEDRPSGPKHLAPRRRWLGFQPRTVIVVGVLLAMVMMAEFFWLYSPFGSTPASTSPGTAATATPDGTTDSTTDPNADPGSDGTGGPATYAALGNVIIRSGPAKSAAQVGKLPKGTQVAVTCTVTGDPVKGATKTDSHWDKITYGAVTGYVTNTLMATGAAIDDPTVIPAC